ncbi:MAG: carboxypeptidase-like regulatory domain-containing protein [Planctomycetota bacterium]
MRTRSIVAFLAVACLAGLAAFFLRSRPTPLDASLDRADTVERPAPAESAADLAEVTRTSDPSRAEGVVSRVSTPTDVATASGAHPWTEMLAGVTGRIVEEDGTPVPGLRVELLEGDASLVLERDFTPFGREDLGVDEGRTDGEGRFLLQGGYATAFHALSIDGGGPRSSLRFVEHGLSMGEVTDVGDIVLPAFGTVIGVVFDDDGEPVAGARVRLTEIPEPVLQSGVLDLRDHSAVAFGQGGDSIEFLELPGWVLANLDRLPVPTTTTAEDGSFRLEGVPRTVVAGGIDLPGHVATTIPPFELNVDEFDLGELDLVIGRVAKGRVVDALGEPVVGAEVRAGATHPIFRVGILQRAQLTDEDGRFELPGVAEIGQVVAAARRDGREAWVLAEAPAGSSNVSIVVPAAASLTVRAVDEDGGPVAGAAVEVRPAPENTGMFSQGFAAMLGARTAPASYRVAESEPGVYVVDDIGLGEWIVRVEGPTHAPVEARHVHASEATPCDVTCAKGRTLEVLAVNAATGEPVPFAFARVVGPTEALFGGLASGYTDENGRVRLGPLPPLDEASGDRGMFRISSDQELFVEHPVYGMASMTVPKESVDVSISLEPTGALSGRILWGNDAPEALYMVAVASKGLSGAAAAFRTPRTTVSDPAGAFRFKDLTKGRYDVSVFERFLDGNPMTFVMAQREPELLFRAEVEVVPGETLELEVPLGPTGEGAKTVFVGRVAVAGAAAVGATVKIEGKEDLELTTDGLGQFRSDPVPMVGNYHVRIEAEVPLLDGETETREVYDQWVRPDGDEYAIDVDLQFESFVVQIVDAASGKVVEGARVRIAGGAYVLAGPDGRAELLLEGSGIQIVEARAGDYATLVQRLECDASGSPPHLRLELVRPVPCTGRVVLPQPQSTPGWAYLAVSMADGGQEWTQIDTGDMTFEIEGLAPGSYSVTLFTGGPGSRPSTTFELGPEGNSDLVLEFGAGD